MIKAYWRNLSYLKDYNIDEECQGCGGGYGEHLKSYDAIYVEETLERPEACITAIHEVLELSIELDHELYDGIAERIYEALHQLELV